MLLMPSQTAASEYKETMLEPIMPGYTVYAVVSAETNVYKERRKVSRVEGQLQAGMIVEILMDYSAKWYLVEETDLGIKGWVESDALIIPNDEPALKSELTTQMLENYINSLNFESETEYLIYTDLLRQHTHVFTGKNGEWKFLHTFVCASGKNETPTTRGTFKISERGSWFYSRRLGSGGKFWVRFNETYLFHSVSMNNAKQIIDPTLGERVSSGCIRLSVEDAEWIYKNIPERTTVIIN